MRTDVTDTMSYFDVWTAAAMLAGVCVRRNLAGAYVNLGEFYAILRDMNRLPVIPC